ncbi:hypothetical protein C923_00290 [Plasmodium falciparum UGT5.1]|uniref:Uncharacterized protein n=3 Tax=Plasmodium falciparum TaxID=5833 RepID=W4J6Z3_PLAFP|nr:hypothetical protein PFFCH_04558 [Plasmodium falciparum FCH/4]ETW57824.1 hypothetical protein PFUGPA_00274 [Plasmodium falciparum Palo Alto/Uganda]EWC79024.1 hypothetical protein C923_00290 [Plasmodium falciparum UGT5.1]
MEYLESEKSSSDDRREVNNFENDYSKDSSHSNINSDLDVDRKKHSDNVYEESEQDGKQTEGRKKIKGFFKLKKGDSEDENKEKETKDHRLKDGGDTFEENINVLKKKKKKKIVILLIIIKNILIKINTMDLHQTNIRLIRMKIFSKQQKEIKY